MCCHLIAFVSINLTHTKLFCALQYLFFVVLHVLGGRLPLSCWGRQSGRSSSEPFGQYVVAQGAVLEVFILKMLLQKDQQCYIIWMEVCIKILDWLKINLFWKFSCGGFLNGTRSEEIFSKKQWLLWLWGQRSTESGKN